MKNLLFYASFFIFSCYQIANGNISKAQGQSTNMTTPMGNIVSIAPGTTITQTSPATVFYSETIPANTLIPVRWYSLHMGFKLTTPLISIPGISVTAQLGTGTAFNLMSSTPLVGGVTNGLFMVDMKIIALTNTTQQVEAIITQPNGSLISLGSTVTPIGSFTANNAIDNLFTVTLQFTGIGLGTSSLNNYWCFRDAY